MTGRKATQTLGTHENEDPVCVALQAAGQRNVVLVRVGEIQSPKSVRTMVIHWLYCTGIADELREREPACSHESDLAFHSLDKSQEHQIA